MEKWEHVIPGMHAVTDQPSNAWCNPRDAGRSSQGGRAPGHLVNAMDAWRSLDRGPSRGGGQRRRHEEGSALAAARGGTRLFERLPSQRQMFHTSVGSLVQDRILTRYREVLREEATRRQHREGMRRAAFIAAGLLAAAGGAVAGYRKTAH